jgi:hypothetical protein
MTREPLMKILKWLGVLVVALIGLTLGIQSPWRPPGAMHVVSSGSFSNVLYAVFQRHNAYGFNSTCLVAQHGDRWEWFPLGDDHPRWFSLKSITTKSGAIAFSKFGFALGEFDPTDFAVTINGRKEYCRTETLDPPDVFLKAMRLQPFSARFASINPKME